MNNSKVVSSIQEAIKLAGLKDGMTISFHHHLRNGDYVLNMVMQAIAGLGIQDLNVNASSVFDVHEPLIDHIKNHVITGLEADYIGGVVGRAISHGVLESRRSSAPTAVGPATLSRAAAPSISLLWPLLRRIPWATALANMVNPPAADWGMPIQQPCHPINLS